MTNYAILIGRVDGLEYRVHSWASLFMHMRLLDSLCRNGMVAASAEQAALIDTLCEDGHTRNIAAGWWHDIHTKQRLDRNMGELLMLAVSELGEVPPHPASTFTMDDKLTDRLMGEVEIADFLIRLFDILGSTGVVQPAFSAALNLLSLDNSLVRAERQQGQDAKLMTLVREVSRAMEGHRKNQKIGEVSALAYHLWRAVILAFRIGHDLGYDIPDAIVDKMQFNASRSDHKPENRKAEDGKKY